MAGSVLDPAFELPGVADGISSTVQNRLRTLWSGRDMSHELVAAAAMRSAQLLGIDDDAGVRDVLLPDFAKGLVDASDVRGWPQWPESRGRLELALAEQLWIDPSSVDDSTVEPLLETRGSDGLIRVAWQLILIGQLHRLALVLHNDT